MLGRRQQRAAESATPYMDPELIESLEAPHYRAPNDFFVRAVLFGTGKVKRLRRNADVYGLVLAGYQGLHFGDDGTFTGMVASELPLNQDGIQRIEAVLNEDVRSIYHPFYCAEYVGSIALDEAAAKLGVEVKMEMGVEYPDEVLWRYGSLKTARQ